MVTKRIVDFIRLANYELDLLECTIIEGLGDE